ncbi:hypothetical protein MCU_01414 [Bartonella elizabethae Re6043vi]|uniref:Uncharacterized protein n=1 Tax=Bartonella elizabethae Re6043vi TaxID=1094554 RepID=A0ABN0GIT2_BAREL|nr:hypothetical protein [Bartonella elizabethae]EJF82532.1 hypothetical protein MCU_01414 [Bartonella elizabethae Re6043vi]
MMRDQSQQPSANEGEAFSSKSVLDQSAAFKKAMLLSTKDYVIICCVAILLLVLVATSLSMKPWEFFQISKEQLQAMKQQNFQEAMQNLFKNPLIERLRDGGWKSFWTFVCFMPSMILSVLFAFFPLFFILLAMIKRDVKEITQLWETVPEQQQPLDNQSLNTRL